MVDFAMTWYFYREFNIIPMFNHRQCNDLNNFFDQIPILCAEKYFNETELGVEDDNNFMKLERDLVEKKGPDSIPVEWRRGKAIFFPSWCNQIFFYKKYLEEIIGSLVFHKEYEMSAQFKLNAFKRLHIKK